MYVCMYGSLGAGMVPQGLMAGMQVRPIYLLNHLPTYLSIYSFIYLPTYLYIYIYIYIYI